MTQSTALDVRLNDYENLLTNSNVQMQSNLVVNPLNNPIDEFTTNSNYTARNDPNRLINPQSYYPTYQSASYCQTSIQKNQTNQQNEWMHPVSASSSSTASTALLQGSTSIPYQTTLTSTSNGLNANAQTQLITPPKLKTNPITIWPVNRKNTFTQPTTILNNCVNSPPQLISKLNRSSFTYHLLTCALITGIVTLILIVISSLYVYSSCKFFR